MDERGDSWTDSGRTRDAPERRADEKTTPRKRGRPARCCGSPRVATRGHAGEATYRPTGSASMFTRIGASAEFAGTSVYSEIPPGVPSSQSKRDPIYHCKGVRYERDLFVHPGHIPLGIIYFSTYSLSRSIPVQQGPLPHAVGPSCKFWCQGNASGWG